MSICVWSACSGLCGGGRIPVLPPTGDGDVVHALLPPTTVKQNKNDVVNAVHVLSRDVTITDKQIT